MLACLPLARATAPPSTRVGPGDQVGRLCCPSERTSKSPQRTHPDDQLADRAVSTRPVARPARRQDLLRGVRDFLDGRAACRRLAGRLLQARTAPARPGPPPGRPTRTFT